MKIRIEQIAPDREEEVIVKCHEPTSDWVSFVSCIQDERNFLTGQKDGKTYRLKLGDIYYFEIVEGKAFFYCRDAVYESHLKLYEFEQKCQGTVFFRASKSMVLNADKIDHIAPSLSGRFFATLRNGEKVVVSRQYVSVLKQILGL
ncbi:MAG: LytTR family DNA-binding domain-containing protein [Fusicatenibacter sp.]|nr:LytTR family transcriptional regulator DNA-binding domain-containing protein [Fusicatenibacter sp.]